MDRSGSIGIQPVKMIMIAAAMAATEPSKSPATCRIAPRRFRSS